MGATWLKRVVLVACCVGGVLPALAAEPDRLMGHARADIEAAYPQLPKDQLDLLVFRIPTFHQVMASPVPSSADAVAPYENVGLTRLQLAAKYPALSSSEIDRLAVYLDLIELRGSGN